MTAVVTVEQISEEELDKVSSHPFGKTIAVAVVVDDSGDYQLLGATKNLGVAVDDIDFENLYNSELAYQPSEIPDEVEEFVDADYDTVVSAGDAA